MAMESSRKRRRYGADLKAQILAERGRPGASVAKVAIAHGWRKLAREAGAVTVTEQFVPVAVTPAVSRSAEDERTIEVELRRGGITVNLIWPMSASMDLSAWMRELLR